MTLPKNRIPETQPDQPNVEAVFDEISKARGLDQAVFQFEDIVSKRSWKALSCYYQIMAIFRKKNSGITKKLSDIFHVFSNQRKKDVHRSEVPITSQNDPAAQQHKLFRKHVAPENRIAVVLHLFYTDLWQEVKRYLENIPEPFDLFVSVPMEASSAAEKIIADYPNAYLYFCPNRGRDIAPFVEIYSAIASSGYQYVCKIHTKKSPHLYDGDSWRDYLFQELIGSDERVRAILRSFEENPWLGMIVPEGFLYSGIDINSMMNHSVLDQLKTRLGVGYNRYRFDYPAGSMFWCRNICLLELGTAKITTAEFPEEHGQLNGTLAHGIERYFGILTMDQGFKLRDTSMFK